MVSDGIAESVGHNRDSGFPWCAIRLDEIAYNIASTFGVIATLMAIVMP